MPRAALAANKRCIAAARDRARDGFAEEIAATRRLYDHPETRRAGVGLPRPGAPTESHAKENEIHELDNKIAIVTGAASGIGKATADAGARRRHA